MSPRHISVERNEILIQQPGVYLRLPRPLIIQQIKELRQALAEHEHWLALLDAASKAGEAAITAASPAPAGPVLPSPGPVGAD